MTIEVTPHTLLLGVQLVSSLGAAACGLMALHHMGGRSTPPVDSGPTWQEMEDAYRKAHPSNTE